MVCRVDRSLSPTVASSHHRHQRSLHVHVVINITLPSQTYAASHKKPTCKRKFTQRRHQQFPKKCPNTFPKLLCSVKRALQNLRSGTSSAGNLALEYWSASRSVVSVGVMILVALSLCVSKLARVALDVPGTWAVRLTIYAFGSISDCARVGWRFVVCYMASSDGESLLSDGSTASVAMLAAEQCGSSRQPDNHLDDCFLSGIGVGWFRVSPR